MNILHTICSKAMHITGALSCIHVFNSRSSLRKSLFKTQVVDSISHPRATAHDSSNGTRNRIRFGTFDKSTEAEPVGSFFSDAKTRRATLRKFFDGAHGRIPCSKLFVIFPWKIVSGFSRGAQNSWKKLKLSYVL